MFTINIYLRFVLMALLLVGGTILAFTFGFWYALPFILGGLILTIGYILLGTVQSAATFIQKMDFDGAEKRLGLTLKPEWLYSANRAYFFMMKGSIAAYRKESEEAEVWYEKALAAGLPTDNEKGMVYLQLANIAAGKQKWNNAQMHFRNLKSLKVTEQELKDQIKQFEKALKNNRGLSKGRGGKGGMMMRPGGKRSRPRIR